MQKLLLPVFLLFFSFTARPQCPAGAGASIVFYTPMTGPDPGGMHSDTLNSFHVFNFQPNTTVYFYNTNNTLIDSVYTLTDGSGFVSLPASVHDSIITAFTEGLPSLGIATNGICSVSVTGMALLPLKITAFTVSNTINNAVTINWQTEMDESGTRYIIQQSNDGINYKDIYQQLSGSSNIGRYNWSGTLSSSAKTYYRIRVITKSGSIFYSEVRTINTASDNNFVIQSPSAEHKVLIKVPQSFLKGSYTIFNTAGYLITSNKITSPAFTVPVTMSKGAYFIRFTDVQGNSITRSFVTAE